MVKTGANKTLPGTRNIWETCSGILQPINVFINQLRFKLVELGYRYFQPRQC